MAHELDHEEPASASIEIDGGKMRERRKMRGFSVHGLAGAVQVSPSYVSHLERGRREYVSPPVYARICDALGVTDRRELLKAEVA